MQAGGDSEDEESKDSSSEEDEAELSGSDSVRGGQQP